MSTIHGAAELGQMTAPTPPNVYGLLKGYWAAFQERRERARLRTVLCDLSDLELRDIGIERGEIDYVATNRSIDPRGVRSDRSINI
jgi:uncharacterized protein YjiS (DUF1127 family)